MNRLIDRRARRVAASIALMLAGTGHADDGLQNWFNDPFFRISSGIADCPLPAGPFTDQADKDVQAHHRAEKGTTCWLARECDRPNAYAYDADIAKALEAAVRERQPFPDTSLWVTVQGRVVYIEGCVRDESQVPAIEAFARAVPHVQQATAIVRSDPKARTPYKLRAP